MFAQLDMFVIILLIIVILYAILIIKTGNPLDLSCITTLLLLVFVVAYEQYYRNTNNSSKESMDNYMSEYMNEADPHDSLSKPVNSNNSINQMVDDLTSENELDVSGYNIQNLDNSDGYGDYLEYMRGNNKNIDNMYDLDSLGQLDTIESDMANEFEPMSINKQTYNDKNARDGLARAQHNRRAIEGMAQGNMDIMGPLFEEEFDYNENRDWWDLEGDLYEQEYGPYI